MTAHFHTETLPQKTAQLVEQLHDKQPLFLNDVYLSGGTGLSLQLGHRESEDLDFFCKHSFEPLQIEQQLQQLGALDQTELEEGTLNTFLSDVKLQFLEYKYPLLEPLSDWKGMKISSILDIACTKLQTVSMRGSKKDFVDLFFIFDKYSLTDLLQESQKKYEQTNYNQAHILKSLIYFEDADGQPMPRMIKEATWDAVKQRMIAEARSISF